MELALAFVREKHPDGGVTIADVGVGSGTIAVSLAHALPNAPVVATDTSREALELARRNAGRHGVHERIDFREGYLLSPLDAPVQVIAANLPYVTTEMWEQMPPEIKDWEPRSALDGGADGLVVIRRLFSDAPRWLADGGALFCEIGDWQEVRCARWHKPPSPARGLTSRETSRGATAWSPSTADALRSRVRTRLRLRQRLLEQDLPQQRLAVAGGEHAGYSRCRPRRVVGRRR